MCPQVAWRKKAHRCTDPEEHRFAEFAVVLSPEEITEFRRTCVQAVDALYSLIYSVWAGSPERIAQAVPIEGGADWIAFLLEASHAALGCTRCDVIRSESGWQVIEINVGNAGGWEIPSYANEYESDGEPCATYDTSACLFEHLIGLREKLPSGSPIRDWHIVLLARGSLPDHSRSALFHRASLAVKSACARTNPCVEVLVHTACWSDLKFDADNVWLQGSCVHTILELDVIDCAERMRAAYLASLGRLFLIPGPLSQLINDKRLLASLSELPASGLPSAADIPWTRTLRPGFTLRHGRKIDMQREVIEAQSAFVLKRSFSDGGRDVHIGRETDHEAWAMLVDRALDAGNWIVQEWVEPQLVHNLLDKNVPDSALHFVWGGFVVEGRFAGGFTRVLSTTGYSGIQRSSPMSQTRNADHSVTVFPLILKHGLRGLEHGAFDVVEASR